MHFTLLVCNVKCPFRKMRFQPVKVFEHTGLAESFLNQNWTFWSDLKLPLISITLICAIGIQPKYRMNLL